MGSELALKDQMDSILPVAPQAHPPRRPTIGILAAELTYVETIHNFVDPLFRGIRSAAQDYGCNLLLAWGVEHGPDAFHMAWPRLAPQTDFVPVGPWNTDGLLIVGSHTSSAQREEVRHIQATRHPLVFISSRENSPAVIPDNDGGIRQAIWHLKEHGHHRIAFIAGMPGNPVSDSTDRRLAYQAAIEHYGLEADPALIAYGFHSTSGGFQAMQTLLTSGVEFTAVLCSNDESASGAMQALREAGRRIPKDVAIIGFDNQLKSLAEAPPLTTVHYPVFETGYRALEYLLHSIAGQAQPPEIIRMPTWLVVRQSCGCPLNKFLNAGPLFPMSNSSLMAGDQTTADRPLSLESKPGFDSEAELVQAFIETLQTEVQSARSKEISAICKRLIHHLTTSLSQKSGEPLQLADSLQQTESSEDNPHAWQAALLALSSQLARMLPNSGGQPPRPGLSDQLLRQAQVAINESVWRQYNRHVIHQRWQAEEVGLLTTRLLSVLDEQQILQKLAAYLPRLGIRHAQVAFFEPAPDDPVMSYRLSPILCPPELAGQTFPSRDFPPAGLYPPTEPFWLALVPLVAQTETLGFVAFDAHHLSACSIIAQQLATALKSAQLYQAATQARQLAEEANRLKSRFLSTVSHELRTPLNLVVGLSEMLLRRQAQDTVALPDHYREDVERIHLSTQHLGWLIRDVLDLASSDAGQLQLTCEPLDLAEGLATVIEIGAQIARDKGLTWQAEVPGDLPRVWADRTRLRQVLLNLVSNAVKFTEQGTITLEVKTIDDFRLLTLVPEAQRSGIVDGENQQSATNNQRVGERILFSISDTGLGIPPEEQGVIFDEFRQSDRTATRGYGGLGLGLAICKRLVELHGGRIGVHSSGQEGAGSTFYFTLPILEAYPGLPVYTESENPAFGARRVLILAESRREGEPLAAHLSQQGFETSLHLLSAGADWLPQVWEVAPGAIVLDFKLATERGWEILKVLKENPKTQPTPVLFFGLSLEANTGSVLEMDYLIKPIRAEQLGEALAQQNWPSDTQIQKTILIVDDDPGILDLHTRMVQSHSAAHRVLRAADGRAALKLIRESPPDLVLLDLMMPGLDGFGVLEAMRQGETTRNIPVIVLTARVLSEADMARLNNGVATVLGKGMFTVQETLRHIEVTLNRTTALGSVAQRVVRRAMGYLHTHYAEDISREAVAQYVGVSEGYLTRCFRQETGLTLITYLNRYRISLAKTLLAGKAQSVTEVALAVGFSNVAYFSRVFHREVGLWPSAYQRQPTANKPVKS